LELQRAPSDSGSGATAICSSAPQLNLTRNAIEASKPGSRVRLRVDRSDGQAMLAVEDQGAGIPRIASPRSSSRSPRRSALACTWEWSAERTPIVAAHGGAISVKSKPGEGPPRIVR